MYYQIILTNEKFKRIYSSIKLNKEAISELLNLPKNEILHFELLTNENIKKRPKWINKKLLFEDLSETQKAVDKEKQDSIKLEKQLTTKIQEPMEKIIKETIKKSAKQAAKIKPTKNKFTGFFKKLLKG